MVCNFWVVVDGGMVGLFWLLMGGGGFILGAGRRRWVVVGSFW